MAMVIDYKTITVKELADGYLEDKETNGVVGYSGKLNIRPKYQREFVYDDKKRNLVIDSILKDYPLNVFYWVKNSDTDFEVLDGQQRSISICQYVNNYFSITLENDKTPLYFHTLPNDLQEKILNYQLSVYWCEGTDSEKLAWFDRINVSGEPLNQQELLNATYSGQWLTDAKKYFSRKCGAAYQLGKDYLTGSEIRQDYLATTLKWISDKEKKSVGQFMSDCNKDFENASALWNYFQAVISWVRRTFPNYRKEIMKGVDWGILYNKYGNKPDIDTDKLEERIKQLIDDDDVSNLKGIFFYLFDNDESHLSIRKFDDKMKRKILENQGNKCKKCGKEITFEEADADHITPWSKGGHTTIENCQILCKSCNRRKSDN